MSSYDIRTALPADIAAVSDVFVRSALSNEGDRGVLLSHPDALQFEARALKEGRTRVATNSQERVVGFSTTRPAGSSLELEDLFVDPDWMRLGIGALLVADVVEKARRSGVSHIEVTANTHALAFYEQAGFVFVRKTETRFSSAPLMRLDVSAR